MRMKPLIFVEKAIVYLILVWDVVAKHVRRIHGKLCWVKLCASGLALVDLYYYQLLLSLLH
jgi:hypothetical protein